MQLTSICHREIYSHKSQCVGSSPSQKRSHTSECVTGPVHPGFSWHDWLTPFIDWLSLPFLLTPRPGPGPRPGAFTISWWEEKLRPVKVRLAVVNGDRERDRWKRSLKTHLQREESDQETGKGRDCEHPLSGRTWWGGEGTIVKTTTNNLLSTFSTVDTEADSCLWMTWINSKINCRKQILLFSPLYRGCSWGWMKLALSETGWGVQEGGWTDSTVTFLQGVQSHSGGLQKSPTRHW